MKNKILALLPSLSLLAACYSPSIAPHTQRCAPGGVCASGYTCGDDDYCYKTGSVPNFDLSVLDFTVRCTVDSCRTGPKPVCDSSATSATSGQCVGCLANSDCGNSLVCDPTTNDCVPGCATGHACGDAGVCVTNVCNFCHADKDCLGGTPQNPNPSKGTAPPLKCNVATGVCLGCVVDADCGPNQYCGPANTCIGSAAAGNCKNDGECQPTTDGGPAADGGVPTSACCNHLCTAIVSDQNNCGACGQVCGMSGGANPAQLVCCNSACVDETADPTNCGACGNACASSFSNASVICSDGQCVESGCNVGFADCTPSGSVSTGCTTNIASDPMNCLGCGMTCPVTNGVGGCNNGCTVASCSTNFADCNGAYTDGCETNLTNDVKNCGACGNTCQPPANGVAACIPPVAPSTTPTCGLGACNTGFLDCDKEIPVANGCEVNVMGNDPANCGGCGKVCAGTCKAGQCVLCNGIPNAFLITIPGGNTYCKVQVSGPMTDSAVLNACLAAGLSAPCQGSSAAACIYNDAFCAANTYETCAKAADLATGSTVMANLAVALCGAGAKPATCSKLYDVFQYMGNNLAFGQKACGVVQNKAFCATDQLYTNRYALCIQ